MSGDNKILQISERRLLISMMVEENMERRRAATALML